MLPTKVEIKLKKLNGAKWSNLNFPRTVMKNICEDESPKIGKPDSVEEQIDAVALTDL